MIRDVHRESEKVGPKINTSPHNMIQKDLPTIQCKEKTIYLGQVMAFKNKMDLESNRRKSLA